MKTLAKVGATSNSLWWAINGVSVSVYYLLQQNEAQRCARTHTQAGFCLDKSFINLRLIRISKSKDTQFAAVIKLFLSGASREIKGLDHIIGPKKFTLREF